MKTVKGFLEDSQAIFIVLRRSHLEAVVSTMAIWGKDVDNDHVKLALNLRAAKESQGRP